MKQKNESEKIPRGRKSAKEHSLAAELIQMPDDDVLFQKIITVWERLQPCLMKIIRSSGTGKVNLIF